MECYHFMGCFALVLPVFCTCYDQLHHRFYFAIGVIVLLHETSRMAINKIAIWFDLDGLVSNIHYFYSCNEFEWRWRRQHVYVFVTRFYFVFVSFEQQSNVIPNETNRILFVLDFFSACSILTWAIVASMIFGGNTFLWRERKEKSTKR